MTSTYSPQTLIRKLKHMLQGMKHLSNLDRLPRLAFVGRRGSGKTTLLNAIFEKRIGESSAVRPGNADSMWKVFQTLDDKKIEVLDTRGFQTAEPTSDSDSNYLQSTIQALQNKHPDIFLFLIKAKEVNSAVKADLDALENLLHATYEFHQVYPAVLVVITQCDELDPPYINISQDKRRHPEEWEEKIRNVQVAIQVIREHLEQRMEIYPYVVDIVPIAAFIRIRADGSIDPDPRLDHRWNIDTVAETIIQEMPLVAKIGFARIASLKKFQESTAKSLIYSSAGAAMVANTTSMRGTGNAFVTLIQLLMSYGIAYLSGYDISRKYAFEFLTTTGFSLGTSLTIGRVNSTIDQRNPQHRKLLSTGVAAISTLALGLAILKYLSRERE